MPAQLSMYSEQFRRDALQLVASSGRPIAKVARSLGIAEGTLWNWVRAARDAADRATDPDAAGNADMHLSFGSTGDAFDNAAMETFFALLQRNVLDRRASETRDDHDPTATQAA